MKPMVFTLVGKDKPGLIESLSKQILALGGNWLGSSFSHMAGHFAGFVEVELPEDQHQALTDAFAKHPDLNIQLVKADKRSNVLPHTAIIDITANDRAGIVRELTSTLAGFNLNILKFDTSCESAPNWGGNLFKASARIAIPDDFSLSELRGALEGIADDLMVDIQRNA